MKSYLYKIRGQLDLHYPPENAECGVVFLPDALRLRPTSNIDSDIQKQSNNINKMSVPGCYLKPGVVPVTKMTNYYSLCPHK